MVACRIASISCDIPLQCLSRFDGRRFDGRCENLIVPVCCSASHIAMTSIRMEPVWMILGESAGVAAAIAARESVSVQDVA